MAWNTPGNSSGNNNRGKRSGGGIGSLLDRLPGFSGGFGNGNPLRWIWVVLALWVPLPMGRGRGFALPLLVRLYTGAKRGGRADAPSRPTTGQRRRVAEAAGADGRPGTVVVEITGAPVRLTGTMRLVAEADGSTTHHFDGDLKASVPVWKRQVFDDGEQEWVGTP